MSKPGLSKFIRITATVFAVLFAAESQASTPSDVSVNGFSVYNPTFVIYRTDSLSNDSEHIEFDFSTKYRIKDSRFYDFYLAYTGRFDFFWRSRESSPVINRLNNPELLFRVDDGVGTNGGYYQVAYGHESNGQAIGDQVAYDNFTGPYRDDYVSRGWDYISFTGQWYIDGGNIACTNSPRCMNLRLTARGFLEEGLLQDKIEDEIYRLNHQKPGIQNYDGLKLRASWDNTAGSSQWIEDLGVSLILNTGIGRPFEFNTWEVEAYATLKINTSRWPLFLRYHNGYVEEISDYDLKTSYVSLGLVFR
ncbi:MAG: hypothetical protein ACWA44_05810 [Thiotrichales bacterium]